MSDVGFGQKRLAADILRKLRDQLGVWRDAATRRRRMVDNALFEDQLEPGCGRRKFVVSVPKFSDVVPGTSERQAIEILPPTLDLDECIAGGGLPLNIVIAFGDNDRSRVEASPDPERKHNSDGVFVAKAPAGVGSMAVVGGRSFHRTEDSCSAARFREGP